MREIRGLLPTMRPDLPTNGIGTWTKISREIGSQIPASHRSATHCPIPLSVGEQVTKMKAQANNLSLITFSGLYQIAIAGIDIRMVSPDLDSVKRLPWTSTISADRYALWPARLDLSDSAARSRGRPLRTWASRVRTDGCRHQARYRRLLSQSP